MNGDNPNQPESQDRKKPADPAPADPDAPQPTPTEQPPRSGEPVAASTDPAETRLAELSRELAAHREQLRDYEKELVNRIADVDDDRRITASQLKKAWQSQRAEIEGRLRRQIRITIISTSLLAVLGGIALLLLYRAGGFEPDTRADDIAGIEQALRRELSRIEAKEAGMQKRLAQLSAREERMQEQLAQLNTREQRLRDELTRVTAEVEKISSSLTQLAAEQQRIVEVVLADKRASRENVGSELADNLEQLKTQYRQLQQEIEALRQAREAAMAIVTTPGPTLPTPSAEPEPGEDAVDGAPDSMAQRIIVNDARPYALQLIGFFNLRSLRDFAARQDLPAQVYYLEEIYQERPWYVVIHSLHDSNASAMAELSRLSPELAGLSPWVRRLQAGTELEILGTDGPR